MRVWTFFSVEKNLFYSVKIYFFFCRNFSANELAWWPGILKFCASEDLKSTFHMLTNFTSFLKADLRSSNICHTNVFCSCICGVTLHFFFFCASLLSSIFLKNSGSWDLKCSCHVESTVLSHTDMVDLNWKVRWEKNVFSSHWFHKFPPIFW